MHSERELFLVLKSLIVLFKRNIDEKYFILLKFGSLIFFILFLKSGEITQTPSSLYFFVNGCGLKKTK